MSRREIRRVKVWSGRLRIAHWVLAILILFLIATGWILGSGLQGDLQPILEAHTLAGYLSGGILLWRLFMLLFGSQTEHWRDLTPRGPQLRGARETMLSYLTLGRRPLPAYYGHNPLWGPVYLLLYLVLLLQMMSGLLLAIPALEFALLPALNHPMLLAYHEAGYSVIAAFAVLHVASVLFHDCQGTRWEISAMVNGHKCFMVQRGGLAFPVITHDAPAQPVERAAVSPPHRPHSG